MANTRNPILTPDDIEYWKRKVNPATGKRYTQSDIAEMYGVTRSYVSWIKKNKARSYSKTPREEAMEHFPWDVGARFHNASPNKRVRDHLEFMAVGQKLSEKKKYRLIGFYRRLEMYNEVVEFDPDIPPNEDVKTGGFAYRKRTPSDGDLIIRVNRHTKLTELGKRLLRFPPEKPRVRT